MIKLSSGTIYDPAHGRVGVVGDIWIDNQKIVAPPTDQSVSYREYDLSGRVVMPGGVDIHAHIAGPKVNASRKMQPESRTPGRLIPGKRSGTLGSSPSSFLTGQLYAGLGYTTVIDAAISPLAARATHQEFHDVPLIDKAFLLLTGNNRFVLEHLDHPGLSDYLAWLLRATGAYGLKVVNPGGVETWKQNKGSLKTLASSVPGYNTTPRQILETLANCADKLQLPHPLHIHGLQLGIPGNHAVTLETMRALEGRRGHFAHIQFHSYSGDPDDSLSLGSGVAELADYFNTQPNLSVDVGQVMFGETTSMTADGAIGQFLHQVTGRKWLNVNTENESGCGVVPITYSDRSRVHSWQWAIGLEWYLSVLDPWKIALSTDHPNGASFLAYPEILALLMSENLRAEMLQRLPKVVQDLCPLKDMKREYTLEEICIITRAAPARMLGMTHKGHLGVGADADLTVYSPCEDKREMFSLPYLVIKAGDVLFAHQQFCQDHPGSTWTTEREYDKSIDPLIDDWFKRFYSLSRAQFELSRDEITPEATPS